MIALNKAGIDTTDATYNNLTRLVAENANNPKVAELLSKLIMVNYSSTKYLNGEGSSSGTQDAGAKSKGTLGQIFGKLLSDEKFISALSTTISQINFSKKSTKGSSLDDYNKNYKQELDKKVKSYNIKNQSTGKYIVIGIGVAAAITGTVFLVRFLMKKYG